MERRRFAIVVVVLLLGSIGILAAFSATWVVAEVPVFAGADAQGSPAREVALAGRDLVPLGSAMGWVGLAAIASLLATRTWGRRVTGAAVLLAGGIAGVTGVAFAFTEVASGGGGAFVEAALASRTDAVAASVSVSAWWLLAVVSGLGLMACGMLALVEGPSWPRLGARYSRASAGAVPSAAATWDALDRGEDPTIADEEPPRSGDADPGSMDDVDRHSEEDG
jgi:hypothetical protein